MFITNQGLFEPTVMFFDLTNSLATFQMMMNTIFQEKMAQGWLTIYMDDMAIYTGQKEGESLQQHKERHQQQVHQVLTTLQRHNLFLKPEKCLFKQEEIEFLGIKVNYGQVQMDEHKVQKAQDWPMPTIVTEVQQFLGFTGFYRYFIQGYSNIARPLLKLTQKATTWHWEKEQQDAFDGLKTQMATQPVLRQPDFNKQFFVATDASAYGIGTILSQEEEFELL